MTEWMKIPLNIGIIGQSGSGKSSLINAFLDLTADDEGAAAVNVIQETLEPTPYTHPENPMLHFWDLPGVGTREFPQENYLEIVHFENYDYFLIVTSTRFHSDDLWFAREIRKQSKQFLFVRTKIGLDVDNERRSHPRTFRGEQAVIRENPKQHRNQSRGSAQIQRCVLCGQL